MTNAQDISCAIAVAAALGVSASPDPLAPVRAAETSAEQDRILAQVEAESAERDRLLALYRSADTALKAASADLISHMERAA